MADLYARERQRVEDLNVSLARNRWALLLRGALALAAGAMAFLIPEAALPTLIVTLAVYLLLDGLLAVVWSLRALRHPGRAMPFLLDGVAGLAAGLAAVLWPEATIFALVYLLAVWAVIAGLAKVMGAWRLYRGQGKWSWGLAGALSVMVGFTLWALPALGFTTLAWAVALFLVVLGLLCLATAGRLRRTVAHDGHGAMAAR